MPNPNNRTTDGSEGLQLDVQIPPAVAIVPLAAPFEARAPINGAEGIFEPFGQTKKTDKDCIVTLNEFAGHRVDIRYIISEIPALDGVIAPLVSYVKKTTHAREIFQRVGGSFCAF